MKADTPETRAWLRYGIAGRRIYSSTATLPMARTTSTTSLINTNITRASRRKFWRGKNNVIDDRVAPATEAAGNVISWYLEFIDNRDLTKGIRDFNGSPRFSTGYTPLRNRPGILIETHMLKPYRPRVIGTYDFLRFTLAEVSRDPESLLNAVRAADEAILANGQTYDANRKFPIDFELSEGPAPYNLKAVESKTEMSDVSSAQRVVFGTEPLDLTVPLYNDFRVKTAIAPPLYYIVPVQWRSVIELLEAHGLELERINEPSTLDIESYRFVEVQWPGGPFEGRLMPSFKTEVIQERRAFPSGSVIVPLAQKLARVAINLLEPAAPDSLVRWGFFNATFEQKEYGEDYVVEQLAREMLTADPALRDEFQKKLASEPSFAADSHARLQFFYRRSPYWDQQMNLYPVGRIITPLK